ncbi:zinc knuckle protein [Diplocarpon rosae]|nr:zinc knuckle protein [Diplocarpon rosae]
MSGASTPGGAPKSMSSRLLTMKFMQRAANSSPSAAPSTPEEPSPKRRRTDSASTPTRVDVDALADRKAVQAALASEEAKRQAALEKQAIEAGDTRWVLSFEDQRHLAPSPILALRVVQTGFANLDASPSQARRSDDSSEDIPITIGRRSFGRFNKILEKQQDPTFEDSESEDDDEDEDDKSEASGLDDHSDDPTSALIRSSRQEAADRARAERKVKKRAAKAETEEAARKRRKEIVNLNGLTNLSGKQERKQQVPAGVTCYSCGGPHYKKDCPKNKRGYLGGDDGPSRKSLRSQ